MDETGYSVECNHTYVYRWKCFQLINAPMGSVQCFSYCLYKPFTEYSMRVARIALINYITRKQSSHARPKSQHFILNTSYFIIVLNFPLFCCYYCCCSPIQYIPLTVFLPPTPLSLSTSIPLLATSPPPADLQFSLFPLEKSRPCRVFNLRRHNKV